MARADAVNILIVDDLPDKLLAISTILEDLDENVILARSGREALRQLMDHDFAVILLDVNMPIMDGFETASMIRQHKRCANTPIIFITAFGDEMHTAQGYSLGAVDYILAPVVPHILKTKVHVFVELFRKTEQVKQHAAEHVALMREQAARAAAEEANRRKDEFLAMLSHELRNPLAPIRNALQILRSSSITDMTVVEARAVLERQFHQLVGIVDDLLDIFRITRQKIVLQKEPLDLAPLIRNAVEDHRPVLAHDGRKLVLEMAEGPIWVEADRVRLAQILSNLLHNAIKFTNAGDQISVRVVVDPALKRVDVTVQDTGIGIEPAMLPLVFETFAQADQGLDRKSGGLGLGLALVKGLVELHGGEVAAASPGRGHGTALSFWLPSSAPAKTAQRPAAPSLPTPKRLRVLIVEDHRDTAKTLGTLLRHFGHEVEMAHTGPDGVQAAQSWRPDVVLCDLGLPKMNGYEVAAALRGDPVTAELRLIAISGYGQEEDRRRSEAAGFNLHLTKPVDPMELQRLLVS